MLLYGYLAAMTLQAGSNVSRFAWEPGRQVFFQTAEFDESAIRARILGELQGIAALRPIVVIFLLRTPQGPPQA